MKVLHTNGNVVNYRANDHPDGRQTLCGPWQVHLRGFYIQQKPQNVRPFHAEQCAVIRRISKTTVLINDHCSILLPELVKVGQKRRSTTC